MFWVLDLANQWAVNFKCEGFEGSDAHFVQVVFLSDGFGMKTMGRGQICCTRGKRGMLWQAIFATLFRFFDIQYETNYFLAIH